MWYVIERFHAISSSSVGSSPFYLPCQIYAGNPDKAKAIECRAMQDILETYLSYDPLSPAPGSAPEPPPTKPLQPWQPQN